MSVPSDEIKVDESGFLTPGKAITISTMSLFIWMLTGIVYKVMSFIFPYINYEAVCFFSSLLLSGICGFFLVKKILKTAAISTKIILGFANVLLLYTSANGIQTGYCFLSKPSAGEIQNYTPKELSLIPFLVARPWLPDKFTSSENTALKQEIKKLSNNPAPLTNSDVITSTDVTTNTDAAGLKKVILNLGKENAILKQEISKTRNYDSIYWSTQITKITNNITYTIPFDTAGLHDLERLNTNISNLQQLRKLPCIQKSESRIFLMAKDFCGSNVESYKEILSNLQPVKIKH